MFKLFKTDPKIVGFERVEKLVKSIQYKNVKFEVFARDFAIEIRMLAPVPDADKNIYEWTGNEKPLISRIRFEYTELAKITDEQLIKLIYINVESMECHEVAEWFRINGERYKDPHPKIALDKTITA